MLLDVSLLMEKLLEDSILIFLFSWYRHRVVSVVYHTLRRCTTHLQNPMIEIIWTICTTNNEVHYICSLLFPTAPSRCATDTHTPTNHRSQPLHRPRTLPQPPRRPSGAGLSFPPENQHDLSPWLVIIPSAR